MPQTYYQAHNRLPVLEEEPPARQALRRLRNLQDRIGIQDLSLLSPCQEVVYSNSLRKMDMYQVDGCDTS